MKAENYLSRKTQSTLSFSECLAASLLGRDQDVLKDCPQDERKNVVREATSFAFSGIFVAGGTFAGLTVADIPLGLALSGALLLGLGILIFDVAFGAHVIDDSVESITFQQRGYRFSIKRFIDTAPRIALALASAFFVSTLVLQTIFGADADGYRTKQELISNRPIVEKYESMAIAEGDTLKNNAREELERLVQARANKTELAKEVSALSADLVHWRNIAACERFGIQPGTACSNVTGLPGEGARYDYAMTRVAQLQSLLETRQSEFLALEIPAETPAADALKEWTNTHAETVKRLARQDAAYRHEPSSLLYRIENLWALAGKHPVLLIMVIALDVVLIALDTLGMQIASWRRQSPRQYEYMKAANLIALRSTLERSRALTHLSELELSAEIHQREDEIRDRAHVHATWRAAANE